MQSPSFMVLASGSPRRRQLVAALGYQVEVRVPNVDETWPTDPKLSLGEGVVDIAKRKIAAVPLGGTLGLAADTVVVCDGQVLGKPRDAADAAAMLQRLSGRPHEVITAFVVRRGGQERALAVTTEVCFRPLSQADIARYVATDEPFDKAGAYGIQGEGGALVNWVRGSYTNIVGLPVFEVQAAIASLDAL